MNTNEAREFLYELFKSNWEGVTPYTFDNEAFTPPTKAVWVRFTMRHSSGQQDTLNIPGQRRFTNQGHLYLQVFSPRGSGRRNSDTLVEQFKAIMDSKRLDTDLVTYSATARELGVDPTNAWDQTNVDIPFVYFDRH
jgi:hypothetical protein